MQRKVFGAEFKAKVALEALAGRQTVNAIAGAYEVHPHQGAAWLGLPRSTWYDRAAEPNALNRELMRRLDEAYTAHPFYGSRRMTAILRRAGYPVSRKRVMRLMSQMGLAALYPKPTLSPPDPDHRRYPYLLRGVTITGPDHVWSTDITYIRLLTGFLYLVAILDGYSRKVLAWRLSTPWKPGSAWMAGRTRCGSVGHRSSTRIGASSSPARRLPGAGRRGDPDQHGRSGTSP